jgi:hypothetical protein
MSTGPKIVESKDECPLNFPLSATPKNTQVNFDLVHATSNTNGDPAFSGHFMYRSGTGVTNTGLLYA